MKNHRITHQFDDLVQLAWWLTNRPSIYVKSWNRVHPTAFLLSNAAISLIAIVKMMKAGDLFAVESKKTIQENRIRAVVMDARSNWN